MLAKSFLDVFRNNIFVENLSNEVVESSAKLSLWHSYPVSKPLSSVLLTGGDSSGVSSGSLAPSKSYEYSVSLSQSFTTAGLTATIDGIKVTKEFDQRTAVLIANKPDWSTSPTMTHSYLTEIIESFDGSEQRISVRDKPRLSVTFDIPVTDSDRYLFESKFFDRTDSLFVPLWQFQTHTSQPVIQGANTILIGSSNEYIQYAKNLLITDGVNSELVEVAVVDGLVVLLSRLAKKYFSADALIVPVIVAQHSDSSNSVSIIDSFDVNTMTFQADEVLFSKPDHSFNFDKLHTDEVIVYQVTDYIETELVNERYVFPFRPDRSSDITVQYNRLREAFDPQVGSRQVYERAQGVNRIFQCSFRFFTESERQSFEDFASLHNGPQREFYFEGPGRFFDLLSPITVSTKTIKIKYQGLSTRTTSTPPAIALKLYNGQTIYNAIKNVTDNKDGTETITLLTAMENMEVEYVAPVYLARFDSDDFTYNFDTTDVSSITKNIRQITHVDTVENRTIVVTE